MKLDDAGLSLIASHEGVRTTAYWDAHGKVWTIGYGHTATARKGMKITKAQAVELLRTDIQRFEECVDAAVNREITQGQFNALVSLAFNLGCGGFKRSSVLALVNEGRMEDAMSAFNSYVKAGGRRLAGLVKRRKAESQMFASGRSTESGRNYAGAFQWIFGGSIQQLFAKG